MIIERKRLLASIQKVLPGIDQKPMKRGLIIRRGFCACGCGQRTPLSVDKNVYRDTKEKPTKFISGHAQKGQRSYKWKGTTNCGNYSRVNMRFKNHPRANRDGYVDEHILVAEKAFGKQLPKKAVVHHVNGNGRDNRPQNLVICEDTAYHLFLHRRTRAFRASGHVDWLKCCYCGKYDDPKNMYVYKTSGSHRECFNKRQREYRRRIKNDSRSKKTN